MTTKTGKIHGLAYEMYGSGPPVLLLHGLTMSRGIFAPLVDMLSADYLCITLDLPEHGEADPIGAEGADFAILAAKVHGMVEALNVPPPILVGHSFAAFIALCYAATSPASGLVTLDQTLLVDKIEAIRAAGEGGAPALWEQVSQSFGSESLPAPMQDLLAASRPTGKALLAAFYQPNGGRDTIYG